MNKVKAIIIAIVVIGVVAIGILIGIKASNNKKEATTDEVQSAANARTEDKVEFEVGSEVETEVDSTEVSASVPSGAWNMILHPQTKQTIRMAAFLNESFGVTGGYSSTGKAHYTNDGGVTWTKNEKSGGCIYGVEIVDSDIVWVCGKMKGVSFTDPGGLRMSLDGGKTLGATSNYETVASECPLSFLDDKRGWISQEDKIHETMDGGLSFSEIDLPEGLSKIKGIAVYEEDDDMAGCALSQDGVLYITKDHGMNWTKTILPIEERYEGYKIGKYESAATAIRFFDMDNALVVLSVTGSDEPLVIGFRTADGGKTWSDELICKGQGSVYLSPDGGYVTCYNSKKITVYRFDLDESNE